MQTVKNTGQLIHRVLPGNTFVITLMRQATTIPASNSSIHPIISVVRPIKLTTTPPLVVNKQTPHITVSAETPKADIGVAFNELQLNLRQFIRRRVGHASIADDLLQDVFVKAITANQTHAAPHTIRAWLYTVARTTISDYFRAQSSRQTFYPAEDAGDAIEHQITLENDDQTLLSQQLATCIRPLLQHLPAIYRDTLIACDLEGKTLQSIADEQKLSLSAIKSRASRGRAMLKKTLLNCCEIERSGNEISHYKQRGGADIC